jgi:hypothetical protein
MPWRVHACARRLAEGRPHTWLHPERTFFVVEGEAPEIAAGGKSGLVEYHVMRGSGDDSAGFALVTFSTLEEAISEAERREEEEQRTRSS